MVSIRTKSDGPCGAKGLLITSSICNQHEEGALHLGDAPKKHTVKVVWCAFQDAVLAMGVSKHRIQGLPMMEVGRQWHTWRQIVV